MVRRKFRYYLKAGNLYYYLSGRIVNTTTTKTPLEYDPIDWSTVELKWTRNVKYNGIFRSIVRPITFVKDGARILRHIYFTQGFEGVCTVVIERLDETTQQYEPFYTGSADFSKAQGSNLRFTIDLLDTELAAVIKAKEATPFEVPIMDSDSTRVYMDGTTLQSTQPYIVIGGPIAGMPASMFNISNVVPVVAGTVEGYAAGTTQDQIIVGIPGINPDLSTDFIYEAQRNQTLTIKLSDIYLKFECISGFGLQSKVQIWARHGQSSGSQTDSMIWSSGFVTQGQALNFTANNQITIALNGPSAPGAEGDRVALYFFFTDAAGTFINKIPSIGKQVTILNDQGRVELITQFLPSPITYRGYTEYEVLSKVVVQMGNGAYNVVSDYLTTNNLTDLDCKPGNVILSSGDAMRRLGDGTQSSTAPKLVTTFEQINNDLFSRYMAGIGVEGTSVRAEKLGYFYNNSAVITTLGEVKDFQHDVAKEHIFNLFQVGYEPQTNDDIGGSLNGKYDFHNTLIFDGEGVLVKATFNAITDYVASMYAVNFICFNLTNKKTTDTKNDNKVYLAEIDRTSLATNGAFKLSRPQNQTGASVSGVLNPATVFNPALSPKHNFLRLGPVLHTARHLMESSYLTYRTTTKNTEFSSKLDPTVATIVEKDNVKVSTLAAPLFLPILFSFTTEVPTDIMDLVENNPYGRINFQWRNPNTSELHTLGGFIYNIGVKPSNNEEYTWQLLAAPDTDLSKLV